MIFGVSCDCVSVCVVRVCVVRVCVCGRPSPDAP